MAMIRDSELELRRLEKTKERAYYTTTPRLAMDDLMLHTVEGSYYI
jgi:hypothetical protein